MGAKSAIFLLVYFGIQNDFEPPQKNLNQNKSFHNHHLFKNNHEISYEHLLVCVRTELDPSPGGIASRLCRVCIIEYEKLNLDIS
jgi:hypothetical protein